MNKQVISCTFETKEFDEQQGLVRGFASVFGVLDSYNDVVLKGAFVRSLQEKLNKGQKVPMLYQHDPSIIIGEWLELKETEYGLWAVGKLYLDFSEKAREVYNLLKAKVLNGLSIGFIPVDDEIVCTDTEIERHIKDVELFEISIVTFPANEQSLVTDVKERKELTIRDAEKALTAAGFSQKRAKQILSGGFNSGLQRDVDKSEQCDADVKATESMEKIKKLFL